MPTLVRWQNLTKRQQERVLQAFVHWNHPSALSEALRAAGWDKWQWAAAHSFYITVRGELAERPGYAVPQTLGPDPSYEALLLRALEQKVAQDLETQAGQTTARTQALIERETRPGWAAAEAAGFPDVTVGRPDPDGEVQDGR